MSDDGHGGTFVADPPANPTAARFVEAAAGFGGGRDQGLATIHAGGTTLLNTPPLLTGATSSR